jgi:hypothetical protein
MWRRPRVLLVDTPHLLSDLLRRAAAERGVRVLSQRRLAQGLRAVTRARPDAVVVGLTAARRCPDWLLLARTDRLIGVGLDDGQSSLFEPAVRRLELGPLSPEEIIAAVTASPSSSRCGRVNGQSPESER